MKRDDIKIGSVYIARVSGRRVKVKIDADLGEGIRFNGKSYHRGWTATNLMTRRTVRITTAQRLSPEVTRAPAAPAVPAATPALVLALDLVCMAEREAAECPDPDPTNGADADLGNPADGDA